MNIRVAAIIPARNEERTIARVIDTVCQSKVIDEVIVISDGSIDHTAAIAKAHGAHVFVWKKNKGKGEALQFAITQTKADILFFCDADLVGLQSYHVREIVQPVLQGNVVMCVGLRDRWGIPRLVAQLDPLMAIGGERALRRKIFQNITKEEYHGFGVEVALNAYCHRSHFPVQYIEMIGVTHLPKEIKWGKVTGLTRRILWLWQIFRMRILAFFPRKKSWRKH